MKKSVQKIITELFNRYPSLLSCKEDIIALYNATIESYNSGGMILVCGNGGSAADAEHIVGELMKGFLLKRKLPASVQQQFDLAGCGELAQKLQGALPAISLVSQSAIATAFGNDVDPDLIFAQQVYGYNNPHNLLLGISTSGNSKNVINAIKVANVLGMKTVALVGRDGGELAKLADISLIAPEEETFKIQELHLPLYHAWCAMVEAHFFGNA